MDRSINRIGRTETNQNQWKQIYKLVGKGYGTIGNSYKKLVSSQCMNRLKILMD